VLEISFDSSFEDTSLQENTPTALKAFDTDIRAQPHHLPFIAAARVDFTEFYHIAELYIWHYAPTLSDGIDQIIVDFVPEFFRGATGGGREILPLRGIDYLP
jgi:hypothetical protein